MLRYKFIITLISIFLLASLAGCFAGAETPSTTETGSNSSDQSQTIIASTPTFNPEMAQVPLSIDYLRSRTYEGSDFVFEQTLDPGSNYNRYIVSYRSDGLKIYALMTIPWEQ